MVGSSSATDCPQADKVDLHKGGVEAFTDGTRKKADRAFVGHSDARSYAPNDNGSDLLHVE